MKRSPEIYEYGLPEAERDAAKWVEYALHQLDQFVGDFADCISLFEFSSQNGELPHGWRSIAARHGTIALFNFDEAVDAIQQGQFGRCPTLRDMVAKDKLRAANKLFEESFKGFEKLRYAATHRGAIYRGEDPYEEHAVETPYVGVGFTLTAGRMSGSIFEGSKFTTWWKGVEVSYNVTQGSVATLAQVRDLWYEAFEQASTLTEERFRELCPRPQAQA